MTREMVQEAERLVTEAQAYVETLRQAAVVDGVFKRQGSDPYGSRACVGRVLASEMRTRWDGVLHRANRVHDMLKAAAHG